MKLSIVVVTWQSAARLERLVESLNRHLDGSQELIVVDNASDDDPERAARGWRGTGTFLVMGRNVGYGAAANAGVARAGGDAVVLMNPDTELLDDGLPRLAQTALDLGALVGPAVVNPDRTPQASASGPVVGGWPWARALLPRALAPRAVLRRTAPWRLDSLTPVTWLTGCCVAAPRSALLPLGPFDPAIHVYAEDLDLGLRAARAGMPSYFAPGTTTIVHEGKASSSLAFDDLGRRQTAANARAVLRREFGARRERAARAAEITGVSLRLAGKWLLGRERAWDRTVLAGLRAAGEPEPLAEWRPGATPPAEPVAERPLGAGDAGGTPSTSPATGPAASSLD